MNCLSKVLLIIKSNETLEIEIPSFRRLIFFLELKFEKNKNLYSVVAFMK